MAKQVFLKEEDTGKDRERETANLHLSVKLIGQIVVAVVKKKNPSPFNSNRARVETNHEKIYGEIECVTVMAYIFSCVGVGGRVGGGLPRVWGLRRQKEMMLI